MFEKKLIVLHRINLYTFLAMLCLFILFNINIFSCSISFSKLGGKK